MAGAVGWPTACYHHGVAPDTIAPMPEAQAAPPAGAAAPRPALSYRGAVARAAASVVSVYAAGEISRGGIGPNVQTLRQ